MMKRRDFLRSLAAAGFGAGAASRWPIPSAFASAPRTVGRVVVNVTLRGGPDLRHMIAPAYDDDPTSYGWAYWSHRWQSHGLDDQPTSWQERWMEDFLEVEGQGFGFLDKAGWLKARFDAGEVAVVNNVLGATSRDHAHAELVWESGDRDTTANQLTRDGWGGRLATAVDGNVVSMTGRVRLFCNGPSSGDPGSHDNRRVITADNTRDLTLFSAPELVDDPAHPGHRSVLTRALSSYYAGVDIPDGSPFQPPVQHERSFREFGALVDERLETLPLPEEILALYEGGSTLSDTAIGKQIRNLFDSFVCSDIFNFRVGSMFVDGFDSHRDQRGGIEPKLQDLFGDGGALSTLEAALEAEVPEALDDLVLVIGGEFGRQLTANGDQGTDHGRGNTVLVIGRSVNGGVYGDQFPDSEITRFDQPSADIEGKTAIENLFAAVADWVQPGAGQTVFPGTSASDVEAGVDLSTLMGDG